MQQITLTETALRSDASSRSPANADRRSLHEMLTPFPVAYFTGAFVTDLAYWQTANVMWERFSVWLIAAGLIAAIFVALAAIIDLASGRQKPAWAHALAYVFAALLSLINVFVHSRDAYTAVVPTGLTLSGLVFVILLAATSAGWAFTSPHRVGADK
ncbi:MAG: hypothetical protein JWP25_5811 [Bradyrhizobium sp.]|nr:hypothetical protein [Bradyrhizobium sp.]